ncbi:alpha/beta fold hydrolase [Amycolatopsis tolypomycina]|uniref:Pimeloyl-ACP methyl ester carboxylesterase n=1 Tax=Amycolatopsis tolypomycina TaxID=208445 RepID=A0A1H4Y375_9PSEU|nr:alpha/beta hydrolase [Amycolatopsis tolypomycina]SED12247.1 Pimeloyl-ACP methyl ester carboxylesterase [Amycolatopsis tolypomycina]
MPLVPLNGIEINYRDEGRGEDLLLVHNLTSNITGFDRNFPELSRHYRTVAADLRGHGLTTHEENEAAAAGFYTFDNMVDDQLALLDKLGIERFYLFGQAFWGANVALHLFDRVPDRVKGLVISSTYMIINDDREKAYDALGEKAQQNFRRMHEQARTEGMMTVYQDRLASGQFWGPKVLGSPDILEAFAAAHRLTSPTAFVTIPQLSRERRAGIAAKLSDRGLPLMLLLGEDETPHERKLFIDEMRADYPGTHVLLLPGTGHYPTIENPADFNRALLDFYAGVARYGDTRADTENNSDTTPEEASA